MRIRKLVKTAVSVTPIPELIFRHRTRKAIVILGYHRVLPFPDPSYPFDIETISATPEELSRGLQYFRRHLDILSVRELLAGLENPSTLPARPAVITFDDAYVDNYEIAFPILRENRMTACFFLPTQLVGSTEVPWCDQIACCIKRAAVREVPSPFGDGDPPYSTEPERREESIERYVRQMVRQPWSTALRCLAYLRERTEVDPEEHADRPLALSWEAVREMHAAGMEFGGHTRTHAVVGRLEDPAVVRSEIVGCYQDIHQAIGQAPIAFAYPIGTVAAMSELGDEAIREAGFRISFSYVHSLARPDAGVTRIPRLHMWGGQEALTFRLKMAFAPDHRRRPALAPAS